MMGINYYTFIGVFMLLFLFSCTVSKNCSRNKNTIERIRVDRPAPFLRNEQEIIEDIETMFKENPGSYDSFENKSILLNLFCDTLECKITSIEIENDRGFSEYSEILTHYFAKMSPINCYSDFWKKKISHFDILISDKSEGIEMFVGYGYKVE